MENLYISDWSEYFFRHAYLTSYKSKDLSSKIGSVIVNIKSNSIISEGYNSPCRGVNDNIKIRYEKPDKYAFFEHSERNAIYNCARNGQSTLDCDLYTLACPCCDCARGVIQSGIKRIFIHKQYQDYFRYHKGWEQSLKYSYEMLKESGILITEYDKVLGLKALCNGKEVEV